MWKCKNKEITELPDEVFGFIYKISFPDGHWYIGKKNRWAMRRLPPLKGKVRKRKTFKENWQTYRSSSEKVKTRMAEGQVPEYEIIKFCYSKGELTYQETKHLFALGCLEDPMCLNDNIGGRYFKKNVMRYLTPEQK